MVDWMWGFSTYPLVNIQKAMENGYRNSGFSHEKWEFSIAMLVHQRVINWDINWDHMNGVLFI